MTTITIYKSNNSYKRFTCKNHAGYKNAGSDIVCASISILVINTINSLEEIALQAPEVNEDEETAFIDCILDDNLNEISVALMDSMILGLHSIEEQYGKYLKLIIREV